jgi:hypothetical protein
MMMAREVRTRDFVTYQAPRVIQSAVEQLFQKCARCKHRGKRYSTFTLRKDKDRITLVCRFCFKDNGAMITE